MVTAAEQLVNSSDQRLSETQLRWLEPPRKLRSAMHHALAVANWLAMRSAFRLHVAGRDSLPDSGLLIFAPNHASSLDAPLLAASLPYHILRNTFWAGRRGRLLGNSLLRLVNWAAYAIPIDRKISGLAVGAAVLKRGYNLVWFPEGTRSRGGELQDFRAGVGALALHFNVPVVPVRIDGAFEALPPDAWLPRPLARIAVRFGQPLVPEEFATAEDGAEAFQEVADALHDRVEELTDDS